MFSLYSQHGNEQAKDDLAAGLKVVVATRIDTNVRENKGGRYDGPIAVVRLIRDGTVHVRTFDCNTEPSGRYGYDGAAARKGSFVDMNGDDRNHSGDCCPATIAIGVPGAS